MSTPDPEDYDDIGHLDFEDPAIEIARQKASRPVRPPRPGSNLPGKAGRG